jgi:hypothetical protein
VVSSTSDFLGGFSVESILKLLQNLDCVDLSKFRETLGCFPDTRNTSIISPNEDVKAIKDKFAQEF